MAQAKKYSNDNNNNSINDDDILNSHLVNMNHLLFAILLAQEDN